MTTPTEGVKLEPLKGELYIYAIRAHRAHFGSDLKSAKEAVDAGWRISSADKPEPLYGPQAAKRIEEMEAELQEARELAFEEHGNVIRAEARALKAERQRDEAVGALEKAAEEARRYAGFYPQASDGRNTFVIFAEAVEAARSSIREG